jgi:hypothetical protein
MRETWYVLENGNAADPADVEHDGKVYRHKNGVPVAMRGVDMPSSRSVDPDEERARSDDAPKRRGYKTREARAD